MGRNKFIQCQVCMKHFRSDYINVHRKRHESSIKYPMKSCSICHKTMIAWNLMRHKKVHNLSAKQVLENIKSDQRNYDDIEETGQLLENFLDNEEINPKSLRKEYVKALEISSYKKKNNFESLKLWQNKLLGLMEPSQRQIIWVTGKKGAEGKSWFQEYVEQHYGCKRVFRTSIRKEADGILHTLSKRTLSLIDVFVFNIPRSFNMKYVPYTLFEEIKDGQAISTKYDSKVLGFKRPNILIVFSNDTPCRSEVSKDRWQTYTILDDKLF